MRIILIGYGNVGRELRAILDENDIAVDFIVRSTGIFNPSNSKIDENYNILKYLDSETYIFISIPSKGKGGEAAHYYIDALQKNTKVITCEKAFLANNWELVEKFKKQIKYSATVGGNSAILNAITECQVEIHEIKAVLNGTLNYISDKLAEGISENQLYKEVLEKGFAEPGAKNFNEVIENELEDVVLKTLILANHSKLYSHIIKPEHIELKKYDNGLRCAVLLNKHQIKAGFIKFKDASWFPKGVNNNLYINGRKVTEGLGAGGRITAERMFNDFKELVINSG
jgi:homoserine dehydrogenase